jgi:hypothetical protein
VTQPPDVEKTKPDDEIQPCGNEQQQQGKPANVFVVPDNSIVDGL